MHCILSVIIIQLVPITIFAQMDSLRSRIEQIIGRTNGKIGVAILGLESNDSLTVDGNGKYPMQSVYKFPLALAVLNQVDKGALSLDQRIFVKKEDLAPDTWSPLREKYPDGNIKVTLDELLSYTVSQSDNNGCDILFRLVGGPGTVNQYIHGLGITEMAIVATEAEMHKDWEVQYRNWSSPAAMGQLLRTFYRDSILSQKCTDYLEQLMVKTVSGPQRLKGLLPPGTIVAHKTGSSGTNDQGLAAATNDVGIVTLPDGKHLIIVVFVSNSSAGDKARDEVIAAIAKTVWDVYSIQK
jgi:beta-lactamase class A